MYELLVEYRCPISRIMDLPSGPFPRAYVNEETCRSVSDFSKLGIRRGGILARNRLRTIRALWHLPNSASSHGRYLKLDTAFKTMDKESGRASSSTFLATGFT
uniref:Uncharacterized protein n=1 Tax=Physcomitrium patens TaxID=3218 RepID=A0A2K1IWP8_PHYPA|nr:hypothetical protein PHYPA_023518 [Physcomitrium patens]